MYSQFVMITFFYHLLVIWYNFRISSKRSKLEEYEKKFHLLEEQLGTVQEKLQESNHKLEIALAERENFILRFSHEIRNPLNCVLGNIELSLDTTSDPTIKEMLHEANICGEILLQLINNILDSGKFSSGRLEISPKLQDIRSFLERMWAVASEIIHKNGLIGLLYLDRWMPEQMEFDSRRLMQIMINLISNAAKFTKNGYVKLFIDFEEASEITEKAMQPRYKQLLDETESANQEAFVEAEEQDEIIHEVVSFSSKKFKKNSNVRVRGQKNFKIFVKDSCGLPSSHSRNSVIYQDAPNEGKEGFIRIEIVDSGCGIRKDDLAVLFTKFGQIRNQSAMRDVGTGLGLWVTKELVGLMDGEIKIYSTPGWGTAVVIMFKSRSNQPNVRTSFTFEEFTPLALSESSTQRLRALVVDDAAYNREINTKFLRKSGVLEIETAENGQKALELYILKGKGYYSLITMDLDMPIMNGREAIQKIRTHEQKMGWPPVHIIMITAYSESRTRNELLNPKGAFRANVFLSKPISYDVIQKAVKDVKDIMFLHSALNPKRRFGTVLIVDDDKFNQLTLIKFFKHVGLQCIAASSDTDAVSQFERYKEVINLVVVDCGMKTGDGFAVAEAISKSMITTKSKGGRKIPIVGMSGAVTQGIEVEKRCLETGVQKLLTKPINLMTIEELVASYVKNMKNTMPSATPLDIS